MSRKSDKKGFTLAEMLIALGVIGVIAALTMPLLHKIIPTKEDTTKKKADYLVQQIVNQLYDDDIMYPKTKEFTVGFQNTEKATIFNPATKKLVDYEGNTKFCELFASRMVVASGSGPIVCENQINESGTTLARGKRSFTAKDGIEWYLPVTDFKKGAAEIMVDVNGPEGKNCVEGEKYKDSLGVEHTCSDKDADRFIYFIKTNGTISLEKPTSVQKNKFQINVNVTSEGCSEGSCSLDGGHVEIASLGTNTNDEGATYSSSSGSFQNLNPNTRYMLKAVPKSGYYTNWSLNKKRVSIYSGDVDVDLKFYKRKTYCVILDVKNCDQDDTRNCVAASLKTGCKYEKKEDGTGTYKLNDDGVYEYVGLGTTEGIYSYKCASGTGKPPEDGRPEIDSKTGQAIPTGSGIKKDSTASSIYWCGLTMGDYQIEAQGKAAYDYKIPPINDTNPNGLYQQDVRLGTESLFFNTSVFR